MRAVLAERLPRKEEHPVTTNDFDAETVRVDRRELARQRDATRSDEAFEEWAAGEVLRALTRSTPPPRGE